MSLAVTHTFQTVCVNKEGCSKFIWKFMQILTCFHICHLFNISPVGFLYLYWSSHSETCLTFQTLHLLCFWSGWGKKCVAVWLQLFLFDTHSSMSSPPALSVTLVKLFCTWNEFSGLKESDALIGCWAVLNHEPVLCETIYWTILINKVTAEIRPCVVNCGVKGEENGLISQRMFLMCDIGRSNFLQRRSH